MRYANELVTPPLAVFTMVLPLDPDLDEDDDEHSYHFRGKPELLAGISEENLLEQLEIEYLGDITSCNKVAPSRARVSITVTCTVRWRTT